MLALFDQMRIEDEEVREWFVKVLRARTKDDQEQSRQQRLDLEGQLSKVIAQQDGLLNLRLLEEIDQDTFAAKSHRTAGPGGQVEAPNRRDRPGRTMKTPTLPSKRLNFRKTLRAKWVTADFAAKRRILEIVCLNLRLDDVTLYPTMRKPFDILAEGLISAESRGDRI